MSLSYSTSTPTFQARIKQIPEDFVVEEVLDERTVEAKHHRTIPIVQSAPVRTDERRQSQLHFTLEKKDWDINKVFSYLSGAAAVSRKRFSCSGTKDKFAITAQRISAFNIPYEILSTSNLKDCYLYDFEYSEKRLDLGDHTGNRFTIALRDMEIEKEKLEGLLSDFQRQAAEKGIPNYFGEQRFGIRKNTHLVGKLLIQNRFEDAAKEYLCSTEGETSERSTSARKSLSENWGEFGKAAELYPNHLRYEKAMLNHLASNPNDFANSFRRLPRGLFKMFVHAYQSHLFNLMVSKRLENHGLKEAVAGDVAQISGPSESILLTGSNLDELRALVKEEKAFLTHALPGYAVQLAEGETGDIEKRVMDAEGVALSDFKIKGMPEASSRGIRRPILLQAKNFRLVEMTEDELNPGKLKAILEFSLDKGNYATALLRELLKTD